MNPDPCAFKIAFHLYLAYSRPLFTEDVFFLFCQLSIYIDNDNPRQKE